MRRITFNTGYRKWKTAARMRQLLAVVTVPEAATITGLDRGTIKKAITKKRIIARQSGSTWLLSRQDVLDLWPPKTDEEGEA